MGQQQTESQLTSTPPNRITSTPSRKAETASNRTKHRTHAPTPLATTLCQSKPTTQRTTTTKKNSGHVDIHTQGRRTTTTTKSQTKTSPTNYYSNNNQRHRLEANNEQHQITQHESPTSPPRRLHKRRDATTNAKTMCTNHTNKDQTTTLNA